MQMVFTGRLGTGISMLGRIELAKVPSLIPLNLMAATTPIGDSMALKNQTLTVTYLAWNTSTQSGQTGDSGNHTLRGVGDGSEYTPANSPAEVDSTNLKGVYKLALQASEMNYNDVTLGGISSTANVVIIPIQITTDRGVLPTVAAGAANGFFINGTNAGPITVSSGISITGAAAVTSTPATAALTLTGGAASTTGGGTAASAIKVTGGAGAASNNGAAIGATFTGGGTNTVASVASGIQSFGTSIGHGFDCESGFGSTGNALNLLSNSTNGNSLYGSGTGNGDGVFIIGGSSGGRGLHVLGGSVSGDGALIAAQTSGNGFTITAAGTSKHGALITGGTGGTSDGLKCVAGTGGVDLRAATIQGDLGGRVLGNTATAFSGVGVQADLQTIKTQTVTCSAGVTVGAFVGNATAALSVDASGRVDVGKILGTASAGTAGYVGIDWSHVLNPTATVGLSGTTISTSQVVASVTGAVGSVTGAVGSVTGNVGGNVTGSVGSVSNSVSIATTIWQDSTASDFTAVNSVGKSLYNAFGLNTSVYTVASLVNAPGGSGGGVTNSNVTQWLGNGVFASTSGIPDVNLKNVANAAVNTAVAQLGVNLVNVGGNGLNTSNAQMGVNVVNVLGTGSKGAAGYVAIDWGQVTNQSTVVNLSGTAIATVSGNVQGNVNGSVGNVVNAASIATSVWTDTTGSDFTVNSSPGKIVVAQLGGAWTTNSSSVFTVAALANAPTGGSAPTVAQIWAYAVDSTYNAAQYLKAAGATSAGASSGGPTSPAFKALDGASTAVSGTADASGNRSAVSYNL